MKNLTRNDIETLFQAVGELLAAEDQAFGIVVVGGAGLSLLNFVPRTTRDVDVIARIHPADDSGRKSPILPDPLPESLARH